MAENKSSLTEKQRMAIESDGSNVLVSASAGSGKTFVMIERVKRLILTKGVDIDKILCVTFTILAAKEMKQKLADSIAEEMPKVNANDRARLEYQLELLPTASISTIHAFCKNLLSEYFYEVGLDSAFTIIDDKNTKLLVNRAIDRLFEDLYEQNSNDIKLLLPYWFKSRKDNALKELIISIYKGLISEADPQAVLKAGERYYTAEGVMEIANNFLKEFVLIATSIKTRANAGLEKVCEFKKYYDYLEQVISACSEIESCNSLEELCKCTKSIAIRKPARRKNAGEDEQFADTVTAVISESFKTLLANVKKYAIEDVSGEIERANKVKPVYQALERVVLGFMEYYAKEKRAENAVDFSDLEHFTLKLLKNDLVRNEIASRFEYIFTDEYQDTSGVQEAILTAISRDNLFMVGDLKQSIYDFRGCNPNIFAEKYAKYENKNGGIAINLDKNFRSTGAVLNCVNKVFKNLMTKKYGKIDYGKDPMQVGASYPQEEGETVMYTTHVSSAERILPQGVYSVLGHLEVLKQNKAFAEGAMVANLIENLYGKKYYDIKSKSEKTINYGDIAILLRDANKDADKFTAELVKAGISVSAPSKDSIANYAEVALAINILQLIDCYNQDVALASVLKSEIGQLCDSDLLAIRKFTPSGPFWFAVQEYANNNENQLSEKIKEFERYFAGVRVLAEFTPCGELLAKIVSEKGIDIKILSSKLGEIKLARLNKFIEVAENSKQTVSEFLNGLDGLLEKLTLSFTSENAVQIMSIHASKGLEFPIVILARTTKNFNNESTKGDFLVDRDFGVSINYRNLESMQTQPSLFNNYVKRIKSNRMREEEVRLLYVAMTRAKNSLYITGEYSKEENAEPAISNEYNVHETTSYFKMFGYNDVECKHPDSINTTFVQREERQVLVSDADEYMIEQIDKNLNYSYPYAERALLSVKRSVTSVAHFEEQDSTFYEKQPLFDESDGVSDTQTGNAYHRFLELCDFNLDCESAFNSVIDGLLLEKEFKNLIIKEKAIAILQMPIFKDIANFTLYKEQPFTAFMPASMVEQNYCGEEKVLVQGIIDLLAINGDDAIIIDYKYSAIKNEKTLIERYKKQLELYAYAVEKVLKKRVLKTYLINVNTCKLIEV